MRICSFVVVIVLALTGCTSAARASDPAASAVRDAHSSVASLVLAVRLLLDDRSTGAVTQVALEQCLEDVASAQQDVVTATDADPHRREVASTAIRTAVDALVALGARGAGELNRDGLDHVEKVEQALAAAARELSA